MTVAKFRADADIRSIVKVAYNTFRMTLFCPELTRDAHAGHFINVQVPRCEEIVWRRPFSVHRVDRKEGLLDVLFQVVGRGSLALSRLKERDTLNVMGLLGNTFEYPADLEEALLVAGGLGIAPFTLMLQDLEHRSVKKILFYGARDKRSINGLKELQALGAELVIATDDGSLGEKGFITDQVSGYLSAAPAVPGRKIYVCGPTAMMVHMQRLSIKYNVDAQASVENAMACGFGACMGCPVPMIKPPSDGKKYLLACKDGPVFSLKEIKIDG